MGSALMLSAVLRKLQVSSKCISLLTHAISGYYYVTGDAPYGCVSDMSQGMILTYLNGSGTPISMQTTTLETPMQVSAIAIEGWNAVSTASLSNSSAVRTSERTNSSEMSVGIIIGVPVGTLFAVIIIVLLILRQRKKGLVTVETDCLDESQPRELVADEPSQGRTTASSELQADPQVMELEGDTGAQEVEASTCVELEGDFPKKPA